jgi:hypothetical protein
MRSYCFSSKAEAPHSPGPYPRFVQGEQKVRLRGWRAVAVLAAAAVALGGCGDGSTSSAAPQYTGAQALHDAGFTGRYSRPSPSDPEQAMARIRVGRGPLCVGLLLTGSRETADNTRVSSLIDPPHTVRLYNPSRSVEINTIAPSARCKRELQRGLDRLR